MATISSNLPRILPNLTQKSQVRGYPLVFPYRSDGHGGQTAPHRPVGSLCDAGWVGNRETANVESYVDAD